MNVERYDVAVIGAGPAGGSAAAALASRGWHVALIERSALPRHKVCGEFLSPESRSSLDALGLRESLAALRPIPLTQATLTSRRGRALEMALPGAAWGLSRFAMDAALAEAAVERGAVLLTRSTATQVTRDEQGVTLTLRRSGGEQPLHARTVLMAGGRKSTATLPPTPPTRPREALFVGLKGHMRGVAMPNRVELYLFDGGYVGINPVEGGVANVCLLAGYAAFARAGHNFNGMMAQIGSENPSFAQRIHGGEVLDETICTVAAVDTHRPALPWSGMACLGDTATMIPPLCGDGMAMALRSAELCVPLADSYLRGESTLDQWREQYMAQWHAEFDHRLRVGRALQSLLDRAPVADALIATGRLLPGVADYVVRATRGPALPAAASR